MTGSVALTGISIKKLKELVVVTEVFRLVQLGVLIIVRTSAVLVFKKEALKSVLNIVSTLIKCFHHSGSRWVLDGKTITIVTAKSLN